MRSLITHLTNLLSNLVGRLSRGLLLPLNSLLGGVKLPSLGRLLPSPAFLRALGDLVIKLAVAVFILGLMGILMDNLMDLSGERTRGGEPWTPPPITPPPLDKPGGALGPNGPGISSEGNRFWIAFASLPYILTLPGLLILPEIKYICSESLLQIQRIASSLRRIMNGIDGIRGEPPQPQVSLIRVPDEDLVLESANSMINELLEAPLQAVYKLYRRMQQPIPPFLALMMSLYHVPIPLEEVLPGDSNPSEPDTRIGQLLEDNESVSGSEIQELFKENSDGEGHGAPPGEAPVTPARTSQRSSTTPSHSPPPSPGIPVEEVEVMETTPETEDERVERGSTLTEGERRVIRLLAGAFAIASLVVRRIIQGEISP